MNFNLIDILKKYESIRINQSAKDWKDAIYLSMVPLLEKNLIEERYYHAIIKSVETHGPYFIIADNLAMPHASSKDGVLENAFSLIVLNEAVYFENDDRPVRILIGLAATSADIHVSLALPQIVAVFENSTIVDQIINAKSSNEIIEIIEKQDITKYLS